MSEDASSFEHPVAAYALAVAAALLAALLAAAAERWFGLADLSLVFMLAVVLVATRTRTGPALLTALLCFLAYNFFFIEPRYTFYISARQGVVTVLLFLATALLAGRLASKLAMQVRALRGAHRHMLARQALAQRLAGATDAEGVANAAAEVLRESLQADAWLRLDEAGAQAEGRRPQDAAPAEHGWWFLPLRTPQQALGTLGIKLPAHGERLDAGHRRLVQEMADDIAQALLRTRLARELQAERVAGESERLRNALLSSVSHDLRTPLAAIIGAAGSLDSYGEAMGAEDRHALLDTVRSEGERLDRYIQNLLDMTRLGHGTLAIDRDWIGVDELIGSAVARLRRYQPGARFTVAVDPQLGPIWVHPALLEQALFNVIENAAKFSPAGEAVAIDARRVGDHLRIDVVDRGPGIPEAERARIFDMFYSVERGDRGRHGTGLGLAICRGMIGAHGGEVEALPGADGQGTRMRITLPLHEPASAVRG